MAVFQKLKVSIGGYFGGYYQIEKTANDEILYQYIDGNQLSTHTMTIMEAEWQTFLQKIEKIGVQHWQPNYKNCFSEFIMDGESWSCEIATPIWQIHSSGSNASPDNFPKFLKAIRALIKQDFK